MSTIINTVELTNAAQCVCMCVYTLDNHSTHMEAIHWQLITCLRLHTHAYTQHNLIPFYMCLFSFSLSPYLSFCRFLYYHINMAKGMHLQSRNIIYTSDSFTFVLKMGWSVLRSMIDRCYVPTWFGPTANSRDWPKDICYHIGVVTDWGHAR